MHFTSVPGGWEEDVVIRKWVFLPPKMAFQGGSGNKTIDKIFLKA